MSFVSENYQIGVVSSCVFYICGLHDNYLIHSTEGKFILRVYRNDCRSAEDIQFELALLDFCRSKKLPVSYTIATKNNRLASSLQCPEGERFAALFTYAVGEALSQEISVEQSKALGSAVAKLHTATSDFSSDHQRKELNLAHLVDPSIDLIQPFVSSEQSKLLTKAQNVIKQNLSDLNHDIADFGICTGDVNQTNFHITTEGKITLFDFDQCGYGYRAFELGKYLSSLHKSNSKEVLMDAFLQGYESVRKLTDTEKATIPYFQMAAVIWVMSIRVANVNKVGYAMLEAPYWMQRLGILESLLHKI